MLLEHNIETYKQLCDTMDNYGHAMIIQTTGSGKSFITLEYIEDNQFNTLVIVPTHVIGKQWSDKSELVTYVCYDTFVKVKDFTEYDLVIFDEAHHLGARTYEIAFNKFIKLNIPYIGLTADSIRWTDSARDIAKDYFDNSTVRGLSLEEGIKSGILPSIEYTIAIYSPSEFISSFLKGKKISESLAARLDYTVNNTESITTIMKSKVTKSHVKGVLFVDSIERISAAYNLLNDVFGDNIDVFNIHSKHSSKYNLEQINLFQNTENAFIVAVDMLNEGLHVEDINTIIMLRRTLSPNVYFQQLGRGISVSTNSKLQVFDFVGNKNLLRVVNSKTANKTLIHSFIKQTESDQFIIDDRTIDILDVLTDIRDSLSYYWKEYEDEKIKSDYPIKGADIPELIEAGRSKEAIRGRAKALNVKRNIVWTESRDNLLRSNYPEKGPHIPELIEAGITPAAIVARAQLLGICCNRGWTESMDNKLKSDYPEKGSNIPELLNAGKTKSQIKQRAAKFGIKLNSKWIDSMDNKIRSDYPTQGANIPELLNAGKTEAEIMRRAFVLGVKRDIHWSEYEVNKLKSDYPEKGSNIPELLNNGRSRGSIQTMAQKLGISKFGHKKYEKRKKHE